MSSRTIPVVEAAIKATRSSKNWGNVRFENPEARAAVLNATNAYWVDALCTSTEIAARTSTLLTMGGIYSSARQVFAVLSPSSAHVLQQIRDTGRLDSKALFNLESDPWITRSWTYQEIVNSKALYFIAEDDESTIVSGVDFLNSVLIATDDYCRANGIDSISWRIQHPGLDSLACLIADYKISNYAERSAYQVMSAMSMRSSERKDDNFFAMIGAITDSSLGVEVQASTSPSEYFMQTCEAKGDYSFIYSIAPRNTGFGRRWRPIEGDFPPVLPELVIFGERQSGNIAATHIELKKMTRLAIGPISSEGLKATRSRLAMVHRNRPAEDNYSSPSEIAAAILEFLRAKGFSGCGEYIEVEEGFFFPQSNGDPAGYSFIAVSTEVSWQGGGPGIMLRSNATGVHDFCDVGVFIGKVASSGESICIG